jgi:hypothetical protein
MPRSSDKRFKLGHYPDRHGADAYTELPSNSGLAGGERTPAPAFPHQGLYRFPGPASCTVFPKRLLTENFCSA